MNGTIAAFEGLRLCRGCGTRLAAPLQQRSAALPRRAPASRLAVHARTAEVGVGLFGTKAGMTQIFTADGLAVPATVIALEDGNIVTQVKTTDTDGYSAVQVHHLSTSRCATSPPPSLPQPHHPSLAAFDICVQPSERSTLDAGGVPSGVPGEQADEAGTGAPEEAQRTGPAEPEGVQGADAWCPDLLTTSSNSVNSGC